MSVAGILLLSFFLGSLPFSNVASKLVRGVDLREFGSGTVSGTALYRVAGFGPLACAGVLDVAKGAAGPFVAGDRTVVAAIAGGLAVAGHNWSPLLRGAGGRGVAPALGALLVTGWPGAVLLVVGLVAGKAARQTGLGALVAEIALTPVLAVWGGSVGALAGASIALPMLVKRVLGNARPSGNRRRAYLHRLLYDHDPADAP